KSVPPHFEEQTSHMPFESSRISTIPVPGNRLPTVRGLLVSLFVAPSLVILVLSLRPGGLRAQLGEAGRRLKLALILGGIYLAADIGVRLVLGSGVRTEQFEVGLAVVLGIVFLIRAQPPRDTGL
ncbi:MAG TPA: hypothetical protein VG015_01920, partial [Candidatus Dormibacteraeota bacterium]|nr:hypothetical protein [Candidatus Dormibacteraeota bacterium]